MAGWAGSTGRSLIKFDFAANGFDGKPNGITVDSQGNAWVALLGSAQVSIISRLVFLFLADEPSTDVSQNNILFLILSEAIRCLIFFYVKTFLGKNTDPKVVLLM